MSNTVTMLPDGVGAMRYTAAFLAAVEGASAWSQEARLLLALAAAHGLTLDESALILDDVYNLRAKRLALIASKRDRSR